ncbi:hypothetical protein [Persephonella sp.]
MIKVLYSGVDYLSLGLFVETQNIERWDKKVELLKRKISEKLKISSFKFTIMTSRNLYKTRYSIMLIDDELNITFKITKAPYKEKIKAVKSGYIKMPDILIDIPGRALRPQNIKKTENIINNVIRYFNSKIYSYIYSRVDFCTDIYNMNIDNIEKIIKLLKNSIKNKSITEIKFEKLNEKIIKKKEKIYISKGKKGYKELVAYKTFKRDNELLNIYSKKLNKDLEKDDLKRVYRLELRINRRYLRINKNFNISNIFITDSLDLKKILSNTYSIFKEDPTLKNIKGIFTIPKKEQLLKNEKIHSIKNKEIHITFEERYKIILGLFNKTYEDLKKILNNADALDVFSHFFHYIKTRLNNYIKDKTDEFYEKLVDEHKKISFLVQDWIEKLKVVGVEPETQEIFKQKKINFNKLLL